MRCFGSWRDQCVCGLKIPYGWVTRIHVSGGGGSVGKLFPLTPPPPCCSVYLEARSPARPGSDKGGGGGGRISMLTLCGITVMSAWTNKPAHGAVCVCTSVLMFVCVLKNTTCVRFMIKKKSFFCLHMLKFLQARVAPKVVPVGRWAPLYGSCPRCV